jgi:phosphate butyryltransferase
MTPQPIHSSDELIARAVTIASQGRRKTIAVAAAQDADVISAVAEAQTEGFINGILVGAEAQIRRLAEEQSVDPAALTIVHEPDISRAAHTAARLASDKQADAIMKGFLPTSALLKTVLDKQYNLRSDNTLSHCALLDIPGYHKLLNVTDGGMVVRPTTDQKFQILENAVLVGRALELSPVKVAVSAAVDHITHSMPHTLSDADNIIPQAIATFPDVRIQGPLSFDLACSLTAAESGRNRGPVVGDADIFLVDSIEEGNIVAKSLIQFAEAVFAGVIVGARVPVSLVSRTDTVKNKKASLALACLISDYYTTSGIWER